MQRVRSRFLHPDRSRHGSLQSCIRTTDLPHIGDGSHLTYFQMLGNFSFGRGDFPESVRLWDFVLCDLGIQSKVTEVHVHPSRNDHRLLWERMGYPTVPDLSCEWTDGIIGGQCCELFVGTLEIGNLVNPLGHSTDVGFGLERLVQTIEGVNRVDQSSLFRQELHPVVRDHVRTIEVLFRNGIPPGNKGRPYVCRRLIRRMIPFLGAGEERFLFDSWLHRERQLRDENLRRGRRMIGRRKFRDRPDEFWWESFGLLPEEVRQLREEVS